MKIVSENFKSRVPMNHAMPAMSAIAHTIGTK